MSLETTTYFYDAAYVPSTTLEVVTDTDTGQKIFTATVELLEADPVRTTTAEERHVHGIQSLSPPTVRSTSARDLILNANEACAVAIEETEGTVWGPSVKTLLEWAVTFAVQNVLRQAGEDV